MDIRMPVLDGLEATRRILGRAVERVAAPRVIILTTFDLDQYVYDALAAGASGFLLKDVTPEHLVNAVRLVRSGDALLAPAITRRLVEKFAAPVREPAASRVRTEHGESRRSRPASSKSSGYSRAGGATPNWPRSCS